MKYLFLVLTLACSIHICNGQNKDSCNKDVLIERYKEMLPKEVCMPKGYIIDEIYDSTDVNHDGLKEFIFSWEKKKLSDGDTIFVSFYKQTVTGKYQHLKTLSNLFPINLESYSLSYRYKDKKIEDIQSKYNGMYPLSNLEILGRDIKLSIKCAVGESYNLQYQFDAKINNWILVKCEKLTELLDEKTIEPIDLKGKKLLIDDFNYFDYMY